MKMKMLVTPLAVLVIATGVLAGCATSKQCAPKCAANCQTAQDAAFAPPTKAVQAAMTPAQALERLKAGNVRFVSGQSLQRDLVTERAATASGQFPFAVVLSCLDSRTSSELIFDQGLGDVFNARVAGNVLNDDILGSMEFGCKAAGAKLIAVVGHSKCGAVKGVCSGVELGNLTGLLAKIKPAADAVPTTGDKTDYAHVDAVARENVKLVMAQITERSPILGELIRDGKVALVGGMYDLDSGKVRFLE
jgi:carbonic anhydrase